MKDVIANFLRYSCLLACAVLGLFPATAPVVSGVELSVSLEEIVPHIGGLRSDYRGWPNMARLSDDRLAVAYNGGREGHVDPFGRIEVIFSEDDGETWTSARVVGDFSTDDRDGAVTETAEGTLLVNWFTSQAWLSIVDLDEVIENWPDAHGTTPWFMPGWTEWRLRRWRMMRERLPSEFRGSIRGWIARSEDGGRNWLEPYEVPIDQHARADPAERRPDRLCRTGAGRCICVPIE